MLVIIKKYWKEGLCLLFIIALIILCQRIDTAGFNRGVITERLIWTTLQQEQAAKNKEIEKAYNFKWNEAYGIIVAKKDKAFSDLENKKTELEKEVNKVTEAPEIDTYKVNKQVYDIYNKSLPK